MPERDEKGRFKPKQPKARKKKTEKQREEERKRNKAEDARVDDVARQRKRQQRFIADPRLFLTEGLGNMAQNEILTQYNRVLATNKQREEQPLQGVPIAQSLPDPGPEGPTYSPGSPPASPRAQSFPPGVLIKKKNPNKAERAHNREIKRQQQSAKGYSQEFIHNVDMGTYMDEMERKLAHTEVSSRKTYPSWGPKYDISKMKNTRYKEPYTNYFSEAPVSSISVVEEEPVPTYGEEGDYMYELELARQNDIDGAVGVYSDILTGQRNTTQTGMVSEFVEEGRIDAVRLTDEEKAEILRQRDELLAKKKMAKSQEEKDYYKRAIAELKAGDTQATRSARKQREAEAEQRATTTFTPQVPGIKKYPGPANIVNDMIVVSTETGRRDLDNYEEQQYMGKGTAGQGERYTSGTAEVNDEYQAYASRKSQSLSGLRNMGGRVDRGSLSAFNEVPDAPDTMTEAELRDRLERIPLEEGFAYPESESEEDEEWVAQDPVPQWEKSWQPKSQRIAPVSNPRANELAIPTTRPGYQEVSMITRIPRGKKKVEYVSPGGRLLVKQRQETYEDKFLYNTGPTGDQIRYYGRR